LEMENKQEKQDYAKRILRDKYTEERFESGYYQIVFITGIIQKKDYLVEGIERVPRKYLLDTTYQAIYYIYATEYMQSRMFLTITEFKNRIRNHKKLEEKVKDEIEYFMKIADLETGIPKEDFEFAITDIIRRQKVIQLNHTLDRAVGYYEKHEIERAENVLGDYVDEYRGREEGGGRLKTLAEMSLMRIEKYGRNAVYNFQTGFEKVDVLTGGGYKGQLWIIAGASSDGKTVCTRTIAHYNMKKSENILWVPLEMSDNDVQTQFESHEAFDMGYADITQTKIRTRSMNDKEFAQYTMVVENLKQYQNLTIYPPVGKFTLTDLENAIDKYEAEKKLDILVLDYSELMDYHRYFERYNLFLKDLLFKMKRIAESKKIWIMVLHQINREKKIKATKRKPKPYYIMSDLQEGSIEQSCDVMLWVYQDKNHRRDNRARMGVSKNRFGKMDEEGWEVATDFPHCRIFEDGYSLLKTEGEKDAESISNFTPE